MKKLTSHDQQKIASMVFSHQLKMHEAYPQIFVRPTISDVIDMVTKLIPVDPEYIPMNGINSGNVIISQKLKGNKNALRSKKR